MATYTHFVLKFNERPTVGLQLLFCVSLLFDYIQYALYLIH